MGALRLLRCVLFVMAVSAAEVNSACAAILDERQQPDPQQPLCGAPAALCDESRRGVELRRCAAGTAAIHGSAADGPDPADAGGAALRSGIRGGIPQAD